MEPKRHISVALLILTAFVCLAPRARGEIRVSRGNYAARETPEGLELTTPYGVMTLPGDYLRRNRYKFSIPLEEIRSTLDPNYRRDPLSPTILSPQYLPGDPPPDASRAPAAAGIGDPMSPGGERIDTLVVEANRLYNRRRYYEALVVVDRILSREPNYVRGWLMKGSLLQVQGYRDLAVQAWQKASLLQPNDPQVREVLARYGIPAPVPGKAPGDTSGQTWGGATPAVPGDLPVSPGPPVPGDMAGRSVAGSGETPGSQSAAPSPAPDRPGPENGESPAPEGDKADELPPLSEFKDADMDEIREMAGLPPLDEEKAEPDQDGEDEEPEGDN